MIIYNRCSNVCSKKVRKVIDTNICLDYNRGSLKEEIPNKKNCSLPSIMGIGVPPLDRLQFFKLSFT